MWGGGGREGAGQGRGGVMGERGRGFSILVLIIIINRINRINPNKLQSHHPPSPPREYVRTLPPVQTSTCPQTMPTHVHGYTV